jgi:hypothetical protein
MPCVVACATHGHLSFPICSTAAIRVDDFIRAIPQKRVAQFAWEVSDNPDNYHRWLLHRIGSNLWLPGAAQRGEYGSAYLAAIAQR